MSQFDLGCFAPQPVLNDADRAVMHRYTEAVENMFSVRQSFLQQLLDPRRDIDTECGYPQSVTGSGFGSINPDLYRALYEREGIATKVVQLYPKATWQKSPMVFETEDPEVVTPFEEAWDGLGRSLRGAASHYQDEEGSPIWNLLHRLDTLSGIGHFGVALLGIDDGRNLDQPLDGVASYDPTGNSEELVEGEWASTPIVRPVVVNAGGTVRNRVVGYKRELRGTRVRSYPTSPRARPDPTCKELEVDTFSVYEQVHDPKSDSLLPRYARSEQYSDMAGVANVAGPTCNGVRPSSIPVRNELPARFTETALESDQVRPGLGQLSSGMVGTDAQYAGVQLGPSEYPAAEASKEPRRLLYVRVYDESLVQIVQYEANVRNPRFGQPVMYRITLNDPREQHSGIGLPMATVRVHWSRVIHVADNRGSSELFGVPRMRPNLNRILDLRKVYAASAEGYWQNCFQKLVLSTHPQLGGDVKVNVPQLQNMLENVRNGLQKEMLLMGMGASTVGGAAADPTPFITVAIEAICIQMDCPVRVFKGSERGELASAQDDDQWLDQVRFRQHNHATPCIIVPFIDRLIACGVLPEPGKARAGKKVPAGTGRSKTGEGRNGGGGGGSPDDTDRDMVPGHGTRGKTAADLTGIRNTQERDDLGRFASSIAEGRNPLPQLDPNLTSEKIMSAPDYFTMKKMVPKEVDVPIDSIESTQSWLRPETVKHVSDSPVEDLPKIDLWRGKHVLTDGNHRVVAAKLRGDETVRARVWDYDQVKNKLFTRNAFGGAPPAAPPPKPPKVVVPDRGEPSGYSVEWPDLDSLGDQTKAAIALQVTQCIAAYIAGGCEAVLPVFEFFVHVLQWDEELVAPILLKVRSQAEEALTVPPVGEQGHPATPPEPPPTKFVDGATGKAMPTGPGGEPIPGGGEEGDDEAEE